MRSRFDHSLKTATVQLASTLSTVKETLVATEAASNKAYYVIGSEDDLVQRGIIVREGGANLLFAHRDARSRSHASSTRRVHSVDQRQVTDDHRTGTDSPLSRCFAPESRRRDRSRSATRFFQGELRVADARSSGRRHASLCWSSNNCHRRVVEHHNQHTSMLTSNPKFGYRSLATQMRAPCSRLQGTNPCADESDFLDDMSEASDRWCAGCDVQQPADDNIARQHKEA